MDTGNDVNARRRVSSDATSATMSAGDDAVQSVCRIASSFTAVNQPGVPQLLTPSTSSATPVLQNEGRRRSNVNAKCTRNPAVAQYLGLGSSCEPIHLEKYAPQSDIPRLPPPSSEPLRKRRRKANHQNPSIQSPLSSPLYIEPRDQTPVDQHFRVAKARKDGQTKAIALVADPQPLATPPHSSIERSRIPNEAAENSSGDEEFGNDLEDDDLLALQSDSTDCDRRINTLSSLTGLGVNVNMMSDDENHEAPPLEIGAEHDNYESMNRRHRFKKFISPVTSTTRFLASTAATQTTNPLQPIARSPFPDTMRDRSPIIGLSSSTVLRTCFRIGEVLNQAHQASKSGFKITFELYARIFQSKREEDKQQFTFCDLFHTRLPHIDGVYHASNWKPVPLFEYDSKRLLQQGRLCRCIGTMAREEGEWAMTVCNIWEATWDDVRWAEGIVNA